MENEYWNEFMDILNISDNIEVIELPEKELKTAMIKISCLKRNHVCEKPTRELLANLHKNDNKYYCYLCAKIDNEIKGFRNESKVSNYHSNDIEADLNIKIIDGKKWKQLINDYKNYEVSEYGDVRNTTTNKVLKPELTNGYHRITLSTGSRTSKRKIMVHQLVAMCFLYNYDKEAYSIDHLDRNKLNNHYSNLSQCSMKENNNNRKEMERHQITETEFIEDEIWIEYKTDSNIDIQVSNLGRIKKNDKISKGSMTDKGYYKYGDFLVHRLVADAFLGKPKELNMIVNHIDGNKNNNCVDNLEWLSQSENTKHGLNLMSSDKVRSVEQILDDVIIAKYPSIKIASDCTKITCANIDFSLSKNTKAGGFYWKYSDEKIYKIWQDSTLSEKDFYKKIGNLSPKPIIVKDLDGNIISKYKNMSLTSKETGVKVSDIKKSASENKPIAEYLFEFDTLENE